MRAASFVARPLLVASLAGMGLSTRIDAQPPAGGTRQILTSIEAAYQNARQMFSQEQRDSMERSLRWLLQLSDDDPGPAMRRALENDLWALSRLSSTDGKEREEAVLGVTADLALKSAYCRTHEGRMAAKVTVTIRTFNGPAEDKRWQIAYMSAPLAILHRSDPEFFPTWSSPTTFALPPGAYVFWAQDPDNAAVRGASRAIAVGSVSGSTDVASKPPDKLTADLVVPKR